MRKGWTMWRRDDAANAAIESAMLFPLMVSILLGIVDIGTALTVNQKVTNASHAIADLLTREEVVTDGVLTDAVMAGRLILLPYPSADMGWDVAGIRFIGVDKTPTVQWRDTFNMEANANVTTDSIGLGDQDEGVIEVTVRYGYEPFFSGVLVGAYDMEEASYARGRKGVFIVRETQG